MTVVFAIAMLNWKKWGFYAFALTSTAMFLVNLMIGVNIFASIFFYVAGLGILFGLLNIGCEKKAWNQMD